jgi:hypothetical protein
MSIILLCQKMKNNDQVHRLHENVLYFELERNDIISLRSKEPSEGARSWPNYAARCQAVLCLAPFARLVISASAGSTGSVPPARSATSSYLTRPSSIALVDS